MSARPYFAATLALLATTTIAVPAAAQLGAQAGYKFLQAVKDAKGDEVIAALEKPGVTVVNTRDPKTGDTALHIVARRGDSTYLGYLLGKEADPNLPNERGETPLLLAAQSGHPDLVTALVKAHARIDDGDKTGQTALIYAVQKPDLEMARTLLDLGADPDKKDRLQGLSARDYAHRDARATAMAQLLDAAPKKVRKAVSGPTL